MKLSLRFNALLRIILSATNIIIPILVGPYIIRTLSKTSYDLYTKVSVEVSLFITLSSVFIFTYGIRTLSKLRESKEEVKRVITELFVITFFCTFGFTLFYFVYFYYMNNRNDIIYYIFIIQILANIISVEWINEAFENYKFITVKSILIKVIYVVSIFIFIKSDNVLVYVLIISLSTLLDNLIGFIYVYIKHGMSLKSINLKRHFKPLVLIFLITNISLMYFQADKIMLGLLISDSAVAIYNIPNYIVVSIYNVIVSIFIVAIPRLNDYLKNKDKKDYILLYNEIIQTLFLILIPFLTFVFVCSDDIIILYTASKYLESILPLKVFCFVIFLNALIYVQREGVLYIHEKEKKIIFINLLGGVINIIFNICLYFIGIFTPLNAIITLGISFLLINIMTRIYIKRKISKDIVLINKENIKLFLFSLNIILVNYLINMINVGLFYGLVMKFGLFWIIYFILLFLSKDKILFLNIKIIKNSILKKVNKYK